MIHTERVWKADGISVTEIVPLDGQELPLDFKPFRLRLTMQVMHQRFGPLQKGREVTLLAADVANAIAEAKQVAEPEMKSLGEAFKQEIQQRERQLVVPANGHRKEAMRRL